jgi:hypothetical protein
VLVPVTVVPHANEGLYLHQSQQSLMQMKCHVGTNHQASPGPPGDVLPLWPGWKWLPLYRGCDGKMSVVSCLKVMAGMESSAAGAVLGQQSPCWPCSFLGRLWGGHRAGFPEDSPSSCGADCPPFKAAGTRDDVTAVNQGVALTPAS